MLGSKWAKGGLIFLSLIVVFLFVVAINAEARMGGGRSFGGSGSRSFSSSRSPSSSPSSPSRQYNASPSRQAGSPSRMGGFMSGMAGGIAGGLLGGMLFRSLGFAGGGMGGGGGIGLFEILLIALIGYGIWWYIKKKRREAAEVAGPAAYHREAVSPDVRQMPNFAPVDAPPAAVDDVQAGLGDIRRMDASFDEQKFKDQCMDIFFKLQGAWANRDMASVRGILTDEMFKILQNDAEELKRNNKINRLDNIAVRTVDINEAWQEAGMDFIRVRFYANLLDYTVDEVSGQVVEGSKTEPVKFEEYWTMTRPVGNHPWQLSAVNQA